MEREKFSAFAEDQRFRHLRHGVFSSKGDWGGFSSFIEDAGVFSSFIEDAGVFSSFLEDARVSADQRFLHLPHGVFSSFFADQRLVHLPLGVFSAFFEDQPFLHLPHGVHPLNRDRGNCRPRCGCNSSCDKMEDRIGSNPGNDLQSFDVNACLFDDFFNIGFPNTLDVSLLDRHGRMLHTIYVGSGYCAERETNIHNGRIRIRGSIGIVEKGPDEVTNAEPSRLAAQAPQCSTPDGHNRLTKRHNLREHFVHALRTKSQNCRKRYVDPEDPPDINLVWEDFMSLQCRLHTAAATSGIPIQNSPDLTMMGARVPLAPSERINDLDPEKRQSYGSGSNRCCSRLFLRIFRDLFAFILVVPLSAAIITSWDHQHNGIHIPVSYEPLLNKIGHHFSILENPSDTEFGLASAVYFVATTLYSRQCQDDTYQGQVIAVSLIIGAGCGLALGCNLQTIALSVMSWTISVALVFSTGMHMATW